MADKEDFSKLQELIKQDKVLVQVHRRLSVFAFGTPLRSLFVIVELILLAGVVSFIYKGLYWYAILALVVIVLFFKLWAKMAFYYTYIRSIRNFDFFNVAYKSKTIQLRTREGGNVVSFPTPWKYILEAVDL